MKFRSISDGSSFPGGTATVDGDERTRFLGPSAAAGAPDRLLVMLCDRLMQDVRRAVAAIESGDRQESHDQLIHADDIVMELHSSLDSQGWVGDPGLAFLSDRLHTQLIRANASKDVRIALDCYGIATALAENLGRAAVVSSPEAAEAS